MLNRLHIAGKSCYDDLVFFTGWTEPQPNKSLHQRKKCISKQMFFFEKYLLYIKIFLQRKTIIPV